ncbi:HoxN/HupN/NixA family nickel/cobalt transporter [Pseudonocardia acaciae]|uniref:HoxN/HupN/NixA family nickel/cobalt transporter n=1 Tax=Pseudonocardia acaciae TaxID=551276 RepID=UPI0007E8BEDF|nr:HoxN/HupN/NixA family nickel/cobalt transporter [Pseudonocardia acaciae]
MSDSPAPAARHVRFDRADRVAIAGMAGFIVLLHVVGWGVLAGLVAPMNYELGSAGVFGIGLGLTAYLLGMRHAFDADHIAAIDNTTRKLVGEGKPARGVGFWFSLGHSSVVFGLCFLVGIGIRALAGQVEDGASELQQTTGLIGTLVSGVFLVLIGLINLYALVGIARVFRRMRTEPLDDAELEKHLNGRGLLAVLLGRVMRAVTKPWHMYPVGLLFGLGFDTATEISLLVLAGGAAAFSLPWYAVLTLPVLFAAGMCLLDTADGVFMSAAYGWAFLRPVRKVFYNLTVTSLSVLVALVVGVIELLQLLADKLGVDPDSGGPLGLVGSLDLENVGYVIVALFVLTWVVALAVWRFGRIEERWNGGGQVGGPVESRAAGSTAD